MHAVKLRSLSNGSVFVHGPRINSPDTVWMASTSVLPVVSLSSWIHNFSFDVNNNSTNNKRASSFVISVHKQRNSCCVSGTSDDDEGDDRSGAVQGGNTPSKNLTAYASLNEPKWVQAEEVNEEREAGPFKSLASTDDVSRQYDVSDRNQTLLELPPIPRITQEDEQKAQHQGHFYRRLQESGLLDQSGEITQSGKTLIPPMNAQYIHVAINKMLSMNKRYQTVLAVIRDVGDYMSIVNLVTAMHRLGRLVRRLRNPSVAERLMMHPQYLELISRTEESIENMEPRALANFLWAMAALGDREHSHIVLKCVERFKSFSRSDLRVMKTQEISNVVWSLATLDMRLPEVMDYLLHEACDRIDDCVPQALSNMIWACATLKHRHPRFIECVAISAVKRLETFQIQTLANTLWAYSVLGIFPEELFTKAGDELARRLNIRLTAPNTADASSTHISGDVASTKDRGELRRRDSSKNFSSLRANEKPSTRYDGDDQSPPQENMSDTCSGNEANTAFRGEKSSSGGKLIEKFDFKRRMNDNAEGGPQRKRRFVGDGPVTAVHRDPIYDFLGQEMSNILISYARGSIVHPPLLKALERELCRAASGSESVCVERLQNFTSQALANTLWAFASLRWYPARLLPCITQAMKNIVFDMTAQELANSLWSYARFAYYPGKVMSGFLTAIQNKMEEFEGQGCTNSLWALAVLKATYSPAFVGLLQRYLILEKDSVSFGEVQYNQVLQAVLLAQFEARGGVIQWRPEVDLPEDVVNRALEAWASQQMNTQVSGFHLDVSEGLTRLGISHLLEHIVARDLLSIDIAVIDNGRRIAIEVDGPFHFPVNARTPLGHTMIRRRLLRAAGWTVMSIPWYEWFELKSWEERIDYLITKLSKTDATFASQLDSAVDELLSSDFSPGPGLDGKSEIVQDTESETKGLPVCNDDDIVSFSPEYSEDGPVLQSYYSDTSRAEVSNGLIEVLSRDNVYLTSGAVRRLESMGFQDVIASLEQNRRTAPPGMSSVNLGRKYRRRSGFENNPMDSYSQGASRALPKVKYNAQTPFKKRESRGTNRAREDQQKTNPQNQRILEDNSGFDNDERLLPKPSRVRSREEIALRPFHNPANSLYPREIDSARQVWSTYGVASDSEIEDDIEWERDSKSSSDLVEDGNFSTEESRLANFTESENSDS